MRRFLAPGLLGASGAATRIAAGGTALLPKRQMSVSKPGTSYYVWSVEGKLISVHLNLEVVDGLRPLIEEGYSAVPRRGLEIGGLLVGRVKQPDRDCYLVSVEGFQPFESEHLRGPSFMLSSKEKQAFESRLKKWAPAQSDELSVVGMYRSHTRPGLYLDEYDNDLMRSFFLHPSSLALLIRPDKHESYSGGFFFWEDGDIRRESCYREFPFDRKDLEPSGPLRQTAVTVAEPRPVLMMTKTQSAPPPPPAKSRRIAVTRRDLAWGSIAASLLLVVGLLAMRRAPEPSPLHNRLEMAAEKTGGAMRVKWNQSSSLLREADAATLWVTDGTEQKAIALDKAQLTQGSLVYWPKSNDLNFRLELQSAGGAYSESLRSVEPPAVVAKAQPPAPARDGTRSRSDDRDSAAVRQFVPEPKSLPSEESAPVELPAAPEIKHVARADKAPTERAISAPPPPQLTGTAEPQRESAFRRAVNVIPGLKLLQKHRYKDGEAFVPAKPVREVNPTLPPNLRKEPAPDTVDIRVNIDKDGRVHGADIVTRNVNSRLAQLAVDAAMRWRFEPARLNDKPVSSNVVLHFRFKT